MKMLLACAGVIGTVNGPTSGRGEHGLRAEPRAKDR